MNVFEAVKENVTTRQAAELYGIEGCHPETAWFSCPVPCRVPEHPAWKVDLPALPLFRVRGGRRCD
ncbi:MAG: hypothetical protein ACLUAR_13385 [Pilosibacter sp.]